MDATTARPARGLVGNRLVLAGAVMYLLEFVAIIGSGLAGVGVNTSVGTPTPDLLDTYVGNIDAFALMAAWFSIVLLGRVLLMVGIRSALIASGRHHPLMDFAVVAAAVSVTLEVAAYAMGSAAADLADADDPTSMVLLDTAGAWLNQVIIGGLGVSVLVAAWCLWRSGLFSTPVNVLGFAAGGLLLAAQLSIAPSLEPALVVLAWSPLLFWVWMIWVGVVCWRHRPRDAGMTEPLPDAEAARG